MPVRRPESPAEVSFDDRHTTAVYGGSKTVIDHIVLRCMFGTTHPILDASELVNEYVRNPGLAEYVRWEYRPADRSSVIRSIRRRRTPKPRRVRVAGATRLLRRLRAWVKVVRGTPGGPIDSGVVYRATLRERVL